MTTALVLDFAGLFEVHAAAITRYFQRHLTSDDMHMAEDLTAATFERAISRSDRYIDQGKPSSWLFTIARNILIDYIRRRKTTTDLSALEWRAVADAGADHHTSVIDVERTLSHLRPAHRAVLTARFLQGHDTHQTAEMLGRSEDAIKKLQARALVCARHVLESPMQIATVDGPPADPSTPTPLQTVTLPTIAESIAWATSTDSLRVALEREEREALAAYEAAKERLATARRSASAIRQVQGLLKVGGASTPVRRASVSALPAPAKPPDEKRWSRHRDSCVRCGRSTIKHLALGYCRSCYPKRDQATVPA